MSDTASYFGPQFESAVHCVSEVMGRGLRQLPTHCIHSQITEGNEQVGPGSVSLLMRSGPRAVEECRPQRLDLPIVTKIGLIQTPHSYAERLVPWKILDAIKLTTEFQHHN